MTSIVTMPAVVAGATEAVLRVWRVAPGDAVALGDTIAEIETEKAVVDLEAEADGVVGRLLVPEGSGIEIGAPVAVLVGRGESEADIDRALDEVSAPRPLAADGVASTEQPADRVFASPLARRRVRELGLDLSAVEGTGPGGRIIRADVETAARATPEPEVVEPEVVAPATGVAYEDRPVTAMRRGIARRVTESKTTVPHFYLAADVRVDRLLALRDEVNASLAAGGRKASVNDLVLKAVAAGLVDVPEANAAWHGESIRYYRQVDVSMVIASADGLLTPVVHDVAGRALSSVVDTTADLKHRAAHGGIRQDELDGGAFSVSNLGMYGTREFYAVINPPQAGVVAVGAAEQRPVVSDGSLGTATVMTLTLSADHRVVDGATAARLLAAVQEHLENPLGLLV